MPTPIPQAEAKVQLERINDSVESPLLLIGGLAVQQYHPARSSHDIDLVCPYEEARRILDLYPSKDWRVEDENDDEYRPAYRITNKVRDVGTILFGPKITEREPYANLNWDDIRLGATPFRYAGAVFENVLVPTADALAFSKLIAFLERGSNHLKVGQDLQDFVDLTNSDRFSSSAFYDQLRRTEAAPELLRRFAAKSADFSSTLEASSLIALARLLGDQQPESTAFTSIGSGATPVQSRRTRSVAKEISVYLAAPHKNLARNDSIARALSDLPIRLQVPYELVRAENLVEEPSDALKIRQTCANAIVESDVLLVDLDNYGLDSAWELGYAEGLGKKVLGYHSDESAVAGERFVARRPYAENFMHGWQAARVFETIDDLVGHARGRDVYVVGSFAGPGQDEIEASTLAEAAQRVIFPRRSLHLQGLPKDYPLGQRAETIQQLVSSNLVVVILPRYGMDSSWQIGFAAAREIEVVGIRLQDAGEGASRVSVWDNWMHGWKSKLRVIGVDDLASVLEGLSSRGGHADT